MPYGSRSCHKGTVQQCSGKLSTEYLVPTLHQPDEEYQRDDIQLHGDYISLRKHNVCTLDTLTSLIRFIHALVNWECTRGENEPAFAERNQRKKVVKVDPGPDDSVHGLHHCSQ